MKILKASAWSEDQILNYLERADTPLRISCNQTDGYPLICSLWFVHKDGILWSASHKNSYLVKALKNNPKIGLEVATNELPYHGVRGKADTELIDDSSGKILGKVSGKYLQGGNESLSRWLLSRKEDEYAIKIKPISLTSWDFSARMDAP